MATVKPLKPETIKGHMFEVLIRILLEQNGWLIQSKGVTRKFKERSPFWIELKGRGTWHQIDAPCVFEKPIPFIYPLRLLTEMKFLNKAVYKKHMREFLGVVKDITENYFIDSKRSSNQDRFTDVGTFFSANGFHKEAVNLGFAHGIRTISYLNNKIVCDIKNDIDQLVSAGFPSKSLINGKRRLASFKENLYTFLSNTRIEFHLTIDAWTNFVVIRELLIHLHSSLNDIKSSFIGTTSTGDLLHFIGTDKFPEDIFTRTDTQACRVFYDEPTVTGIPMWFEFSKDTAKPKGRFYFDVPPGLETAIRKDGDIIGQKQKHFTNVAIFKKIRGLMRLLTLQIDLDWIDRLKRRSIG